MHAIDHRDPDGWITSFDIGALMDLRPNTAARLMQKRITLGKGCKSKRGKPQRQHYRLTDEQWLELLEWAEELRMTRGHTRKGWHPSESTCEDGANAIRLWFRIDPVGTPIAWQWREESERRWVAHDVETLREAIDQLTGDHPVGLVFQPNRKDPTNGGLRDET